MRPELVKTWLQDLQSKIVAALDAVVQDVLAVVYENFISLAHSLTP